jgi:coenzyme Q-binding protein COQ10
MPSFTVTRRVRAAPWQIYDVIADVARYREFLPLVERSTVRGGRRSLSNGSEQFSADLVVAYHPLRIEEHFASEVTTNTEALTVSTVSSGQALKRLVSSWVVRPVGDSEADVIFTLDYEIKGFFLRNMVSGMFDHAVRKIMNAFEERVRSLHAS